MVWKHLTADLLMFSGTDSTMIHPCPHRPHHGHIHWTTRSRIPVPLSPALSFRTPTCGKSQWQYWKTSAEELVQWLMDVSTMRMCLPSRRSSPRTSLSTTQRQRPPSHSSSTLLGSSTGRTGRKDSSSFWTPSLPCPTCTSSPAKSWSTGPKTRSHCPPLKTLPSSAAISVTGQPLVANKSTPVSSSIEENSGSGLPARGLARTVTHGWRTLTATKLLEDKKDRLLKQEDSYRKILHFWHLHSGNIMMMMKINF